jgi:signal transduction histidine kinase/CheY-like chemotaxis protein/HAMP domain-containing protein
MKSFREIAVLNLRNLPMRRKLMVIAMATSGIALFIGILILSADDLLTFRTALQADAASTAAIIAESSTAALSFQDQTVASQNMMALREDPRIRAACLYDESGKLFASYTRGRHTCPDRPNPRSAGFFQKLTVIRPVLLNGKVIGTIQIESSLQDLRDRLKAQAGMFVFVLLVSGLIAYLISSRLQGLISGPLLSLSRTARTVSRTNNFSVRATKQTNDEVGHLVDAFNHMLEQISERDAQRADLLNREQLARSEAEDAARSSAFLSEASRILSSSLNITETMGSTARLAADALQSWCVIDINHEDQRIRFEATDSDSSPPQPYTLPNGISHFDSNLPVARVIATGKRVAGKFNAGWMQKEAGLSEERLAFIRSMKLKSFVTVPLPSRDGVLGTISFSSPSAPRYSGKELHTIEQLADRLAIAFVASRLYTKLEKSDRLKDEFLATMSHELRTPLTSILGWSRLLKAGKLAAEQTDQAIEIIDRNAEFETRLVEDILDASRIITGKLTIELQPVDAVDILKSAIHSAKPSAAAKNLKIETSFDTAPTIKGNARRLQQIFGNLLSNSIKFTPPGGAITATLVKKERTLEVRVSDTGSGISPDFLPHVFERFRQADASSTRKHGGLGLGLAIVHHLVELHGGNIVAQSPGAGMGATFIVSLPLMQAQQPPVAEDRPEPGTLSLEGIRALVVDDDDDARDLIARIIERHGGTAQKAASHETAMAALEEFTPDILLIDIGMPARNGYELIATARSKGPTEATPAVAITAYATDKDRDAALAAGFQAHIAKPFDPETLVETIFEVTSRRHSYLQPTGT